jgi:hypothetical protein
MQITDILSKVGGIQSMARAVCWGDSGAAPCSTTSCRRSRPM